MTAIAKRKRRLDFETSALVRGRYIIVEAGTHTAKLRLKGTRTRYEVSWEGIFWLGVKVAADEQRAQRKLLKDKKRTHRLV